MHTRRFLCIVFLMVGGASGARGQAVRRTDSHVPEVRHPEEIPLTVPKGTPIQIALDRETRVKDVGEVVHGRVVQPVYAFDRLVIPTGTEALGRIARIDPVPAKKRTLAILNADFTPAHNVELEFDELALPNGQYISL